jgi:hypothetical protein
LWWLLEFGIRVTIRRCLSLGVANVVGAIHAIRRIERRQVGGRRNSAMVLELRLGVERLRRRGGDHRGRGRRRGAGRESGENGAGGEDAKAFGHWRGLLINLRRAGDFARSGGSFAEKRDSNDFYPA